MKRFYLVLAMLACVCVGAGFQNAFVRSVEVYDGNNTLRSVLFANDANARSGLEIKDPNGMVRFSVHTNQQHDPFINLLDKNGKNRIEIGISPTGDAYIQLRRGDGTLTHNLVAPN